MGFYKIVLLFCLIVTLATRFPEAETRAISEEESLSKCYLLCLIMFCSCPFYTCNCCIKIFRKQNPRSKKIGLGGGIIEIATLFISSIGIMKQLQVLSKFTDRT